MLSVKIKFNSLLKVVVAICFVATAFATSALATDIAGYVADGVDYTSGLQTKFYVEGKDSIAPALSITYSTYTIILSDAFENFSTSEGNAICLIERELNGGTINHTGYYAVTNTTIATGGMYDVSWSTMHAIPTPQATQQDTSAVIAWNQAIDDGTGNIVGYRVYRSTDGINYSTIVATVDSSTTQAIDSNVSVGGTYYYAIKILFKGTQTTPQVESLYLSANSNAITITPPVVSVTQIIPNSGYNSGPISVIINGTGFQSGASTKLWRSGYSDINGESVVVRSSTSIECTFNLLGVATGEWNVTVVNPDLTEGTLSNGFTVLAGPYIILSPSSGNQGQSMTLYIQGFNTHFALDTTVAFEPASGITINSGPTIDIPNQRIILGISISQTASTGSRIVNVNTPSISEVATSTFTVNPQNYMPVVGIDYFEDASVKWPDGYYNFEGVNGVSLLQVQGSVYYETARAVEVRYSKIAGEWGDGWGGWFFAGPIDIGANPLVDGIRYRIRGDDSNNTYHMEVVIADQFGGSVYRSPDLTIPSSSQGWVEVVIPYSDFIKVSGPGANTLAEEPFKLIKVYQFVYNGTNINSNSHYIDAIEATDVAAPTPVTLTLTKVGNDAKLDWTASTGQIGYRLYHANSPTGPWSVIYEGGNQTYTHAGAFSDASNHYYYVVAYDLGGESARSNVAEIVKTTFNYVSGDANKFWISIPYNNPYTDANSFLASVPNSVTEVSRFDPSTQSWVTRTRAGGTNFNLVKGEGLQIVINATTTLTIYGTNDLAFVHNLVNPVYPGRHLVSVPYDGAYTTARTIVDDINNGPAPGTCVRIQRLNPSTQNLELLRWVSSGGIWMGTDFSFVPGEAYEITITGQTNWQPIVY